MAVTLLTARRGAPLLLAAALLVGLFLGRVGSAEAHTSLVQAAPVPGAIAEQPPREIELALSEPVVASGSSVQVEVAGGERVAAARVETRGGTRLVARFERLLPSAVYEVEWSALGEDGHTTGGTFRFGVAGPNGASPPGAESLGPPSAGDGAPRGENPLVVVARLLGLLGASALVGAFVVLARARRKGLAWPEAAGRLDVLARVAVGTVVAAALYMAFKAGETPSGWSVSVLLDSANGRLALARLVVAWAAAAALVRGGSVGVLAALGGLLLGTHALDGHVAAEGLVLRSLLSLAHVLAAGLWVGGLLTAVVVARREALRVLALPAAGAMVVLVATGALAAVREIDELYFLRWSDYGRIAIAKAALALVASGLAALALRGPHRLRLSAIRIEAVAACALVALAATLAGLVQGRGQPLPAQLGNLSPGPSFNSVALARGRAALTLAPARRGANVLSALALPLRDGARAPTLDEIEVELRCSCADAPVRAALGRGTGGVYRQTVELPADGTWIAYVSADGRRAIAPAALQVGVPRAPGPAPLEVVQTADLSGRDAERCRQHAQGLALAIAKLNAEGGADGGRKVALYTLDDGGDPERARRLTTEALSEPHRIAVAAPCGLGAPGALAAAQAKVPALVADPLTPPGRSPSFRIAGDPRAEGDALGAYIAEQGPIARPDAPQRVTALVEGRAPASAQRLDGLRARLAAAGIRLDVVPPSAPALRRALDLDRQLATFVDGDQHELARSLARVGRRDPNIVPPPLFAASPLLSERFQVDSGTLGRLGLIRSPSEVITDSGDALRYATLAASVYRGDRPSIAGLRGYVAGLALAEGLKNGPEPGEIAARLRRPGRFTDALASPWEPGAPARGGHQFVVMGANFLPPSLVPTSAGGMSRSGRWFETGAWARVSADLYGPASRGT